MDVEFQQNQQMAVLCPSKWTVVKLSEIVTLLNGRAFQQHELLKNGKYEVLRVGNFFTNNTWYYSNFELPARYYVQNGDLMYAWSASFGPRFWNGGKCIFHYHIWKVIPKNNNNKYFLYYLFDFDKSKLLSQTQGGTMFHLTKGGMEERIFYIPPSKEQTAIATALSDMDELIAQTEKLIEKKKAIKQGMMQNLLRPKKGWVKKRLGEVCEIRKGQLITESTRVDGFIPVIAGGKSPAYYHNQANRSGKTITISGSGASAGYVSFHEYPIFASDCSTISESTEYSLDFVYLYLLLNQNLVYKMQTGGAQPHIHPSDLFPMELWMPDLETQMSISKCVSALEFEIKTLQSKLLKLNYVKQGMMQALLTGKIRIPIPKHEPASPIGA